MSSLNWLALQTVKNSVLSLMCNCVARVHVHDVSWWCMRIRIEYRVMYRIPLTL